MEQLLSELLDKGVRLSVVNDTDLKIQPGKYVFILQDKNALRQHKNAILDYIGAAKVGKMSYQQERLWFLHQMGFGFQYLVPGLGEVDGKFDTVILEEVLNVMVARHESLRTNFIQISNRPYQRIAHRKNIVIEKLDLQADTEQTNQKKVALNSFFSQPFDLEEGDLFRVLIIRLNEQKSVLALAMHHIITDGWSMQVMMREIGELYAASLKNESVMLPEPKLNYSDYAAWQREMTQEQRSLSSLQFWQQKLKNYEELELPLDFTRPALSSGKGHYLRFDLKDESLNALRTFARQNHCSPFSVFLTALYYQLFLYSGQNDICMGMPVANREHPDLENVLGFFVNTVVLRLQHQNIRSVSVVELVQMVHTELLQAQEHQHIPFEKILADLNPERNPGRTPVFQLLVSYTPIGLDTLKWGDCTLQPSFDIKSDSAKFDLTFTFNEFTNGSAHIFIEYATDLFEETTIRNMGNYITELMNAMTGSPTAMLDQLHWHTKHLPENTCATIMTEYPISQSLHQLLETRAAIQPDEIAIRYKGFSTSYEALNRHSSRLAVYLQTVNDKSSFIGICTAQSADMITAIWGILKSGKAYLSIDDGYPETLHQFIIEDSGIQLLLVDSTTAHRFTAFTDTLQIINLDALHTEELDTNYTDTAASDDLAYLMYTSGSTGRPKGVMVTHKNVMNHNYAVKEMYDIQEESHILQFSSISFDIFVEEVFPALLFGATLVIAEKEFKTDIEYIKNLIQEEKVSIADFPTAFWHAVAKEDFSGTGLRKIIIGGEKADLEMLKKWYDLNPDIQIINTYGPTETTVIALAYPTHRENRLSKEIPLGAPIANVEVYILDEALQPLPDGIPGELYIGGAGVAKGYWNNDELTQKVFMENPFHRGTKMYRTGDKVRRNTKGDIEFMGRMDEQVKIRGYRVEPNAIENMLLQIPEIDNAAVVSFQNNGYNYLSAFLVMHPDNPINTATIKTYLSDRLPEYMMPQQITLLPEIPLTINGKTDKKKLALLENKSEQLGIAFEKPATRWQGKIAVVWQQVLNRGNIGIHDNFFAIGGHSLLGVQLVNLLNETYGLDFKVLDLMSQPTVARLAELAEQKHQANDYQHPDILVLRKATDKSASPTFIIPGMPGLSDGYFEMAQHIRGSGAVYGLQMKGFRDGQPLHNIQDMAAHNWQLIQKISKQGNINFWAHSYGGTVLYEMLAQIDTVKYQPKKIVLIDSGRFLKSDQVEHWTVLLFFKSLLQSFHITDEAVYTSLTDIINHQVKEDWQTQLNDLFAKVNNKRDNRFFNVVWKVVSTSLSAVYSYPEGKLPYSVHLAIAEGSRTWLNKNDWDAFYETIHTTIVPGDHMQMIQEPACRQWVNNI